MNHIDQWTFDLAENIKRFEEHELAMPIVSRDVALIRWVLRELANDPSPKTQAVLDAIVSRRESRKATDARKLEQWTELSRA
jgi:hypothetical protein